jgi:hypothetical protein
MSELKPCKTCGAEVAATAKVCPHCGVKLKKMGLIKKILIAICGIIVIIGAISAMSSTTPTGTGSSSTQPKVTFGTNSKDTDLSGVGTSFDVKKIYVRLETDNPFNASTIHLIVAKVSESGASSTIHEEKVTVNPQSNTLVFSYTFDESGTFKITLLNDKTDAVLGEGNVIIK